MPLLGYLKEFFTGNSKASDDEFVKSDTDNMVNNTNNTQHFGFSKSSGVFAVSENKERDILLIVYLFENKKLNKKESFNILKSRFNFSELECEKLVIEKLYLITTQDKVLNFYKRFQE